MQQRADKTYLT